METFWFIIAISLYVCTCIFFYGIVSFLGAKSFDDKFTVKNLLLALFWPFTMWFIK